MNTEQAKKLNLPAILAALGHQPVKTTKKGRELWYHSPFRKDKTPSFHISHLNGKWIWNDFGGAGGTVVDFALQHLGTSDISQALTFLAEQSGRVGEGPSVIDPGSSGPASTMGKTKAHDLSLTLKLVSTTPIRNPIITTYLTQTRHIPEPLIRRHLEEITYLNTATNKQFFAFGIKNRAGGYEIRSASDGYPFKSVIGPRDLTIITGSNPENGIVNLFEGMLDFLSLLAIMNLDQLKGDAIILHSLSSYKKTVSTLKAANYQTFNLFLDNDQSGVDVAFQFQQDFSGVVNRSNLFVPHKDLNEFLLASNVKPKTTSESEHPPSKDTHSVLGQLKATALKLEEELQQKTDAICRSLFAKHPGAKAAAYDDTTENPESGFRSERSISENMSNPTFRQAFKRAVEHQFPKAFTELQELRTKLARLDQQIEVLK